MADPLLYIVGEYPSQTETFIASEIRGLRKRGFNIDVLAVGNISAARLLDAAARPRHAWRVFQTLRRDGGCTNRRAAAVAIKAAAAARLRARHVHAHFLGLPATIAWAVSQITGVPYSISAHARDIYAETTPEYVVEGATFRTVCTETAAQFLDAKYPGAQFDLVRHGLKTQSRTPTQSPNGKFTILAVGRLVEKKGFEFLISACRILKDRAMPFQCRIVGDGPLKKCLQKRIGMLGMSDNVSIEPFRPHNQMPQLYAGADVLVAPSVVAGDGDRDGIPNVVLEAMAHAVPVVATDAGAIPEAVVHGVTGFIAPQRNAAALARTLETILTHPQLRRRAAQQAQQLVASEFDPDMWLDRLRMLFENSAPVRLCAGRWPSR